MTHRLVIWPDPNITTDLVTRRLGSNSGPIDQKLVRNHVARSFKICLYTTPKWLKWFEMNDVGCYRM